MREHDSGKTLTFGADDLDRILHGLLTGDRDALILANEINNRWRVVVVTEPEPEDRGIGGHA